MNEKTLELVEDLVRDMHTYVAFILQKEFHSDQTNEKIARDSKIWSEYLSTCLSINIHTLCIELEKEEHIPRHIRMLLYPIFLYVADVYAEKFPKIYKLVKEKK